MMNFHRMIKHNKKMWHIQDFGSHAKGLGHPQGLEVKTCLYYYFKTALVHFIKLHRKVEYNRI